MNKHSKDFQIPADEIPADEIPADEIPADEIPADEIPADEIPADESRERGVKRKKPMDKDSKDEIPAADEIPADEIPADEIPADENPVLPVEPEEAPVAYVGILQSSKSSGMYTFRIEDDSDDDSDIYDVDAEIVGDIGEALGAIQRVNAICYELSEITGKEILALKMEFV